MKGIERMPFKGEFFGRNVIGPSRKNLVIPNELANKLITNVRRGNT